MKRMDRYEESNNNRMSRLDRNKELYENLSNNAIYANITDVTNANAFEIPNSSTHNAHTTREAYQTMSKYQKVEPLPKNKKDLEDFKYLYQNKENKIYDINSVIEEARKTRGDSDKLEEKRKLKDNSFNILLSNNKKALEKYREEKKKRMLTPEEEEIREIIDTIATKTLAGELDKETTVDLLSDLMATNILDKVDGANEQQEKTEDSPEIIKVLEEETEKEEEEEKKEDKEKDTDFYSKSMDLTDKDFELSDEFKEKDLPLGIKVLIFFLVIVIVGVAGYFIFLRLKKRTIQLFLFFWYDIYGEEKMNTVFIVNDYTLMWNLLFQTSISENIYKVKQKIWNTYKNEYNSMFQDKNLILKDYKNFIPNNDTIYNILLDNREYEKIKKQAEKYRLELMKIWDKNQKETDYLYKSILRMKKENYTFFVINKEFNIVNQSFPNTLIIGREIDKKEPLNILFDINLEVAKNNTKKYKEEYESIKNAILELAIINEYGTRLIGRSNYQSGNPSLSSLKRFLYPYWLMYLGVKEEEFFTYMMRDKIVFEVEKYAYEKELKKMNIEEFIDFCIRNKRYIVRRRQEEII